MSDKINHKRAVQYPSHVNFYLIEKDTEGAMLGPFQNPPLDNLHPSPFMTLDKSSSDNRTGETDLSWPLGTSMNWIFWCYTGASISLFFAAIPVQTQVFHLPPNF